MMEIAIFGAGVAGLMTAIALRAQGLHPHIYERSALSHQAGIGFILTAEAVAKIESNGVRMSSVPLNEFRYLDSGGEVLHREPMLKGSRCLRRPELIRALLRILPEDGKPVFDAELRELRIQNELVTTAHFSSGECIRADLYVGAEGIHSKAREAMFPCWPKRLAPVMELVGCIYSEEGSEWAGHNFNKFHAKDGGLALGILPVDSSHVIWFMQFDAGRFAPPPESAGPEARKAFAQRLVGNWAAPIPGLINQTDFSRVYLWHPIDADVLPRFHRGNLALIGDAAHPLLPFTSQGVSAAIEDAAVLADVLTTEVPVEQALVHYSAKRREICSQFVEQGRNLTQRFLAPQDASSFSMPLAK